MQILLLVLHFEHFLLTHADQLLGLGPPVVTELRQLCFLFFKDKLELIAAALHPSLVLQGHLVLEIFDVRLLLGHN